MHKVIYPGSFDPLTVGHLDIIQRLAHLFDAVIVGIGVNPAKKTLFTVTERQQLIEASVAASNLSNVKVINYTGLTTEVAKAQEVDLIARGLRDEQDLHYEKKIAELNRRVSGIETIFLLAKPEHQVLASSYVKELASYKADISAMVPAPVLSALQAKYKGNSEDA
ncbi:pantetheine-phosphate adenylyltransferase [Weissella kandleri]|uniref:pantetheine-phosphate adenylyltransferase n=1 Tax=Weissella kandleri TaxID=1616 RepID=UPI00387E50DF